MADAADIAQDYIEKRQQEWQHRMAASKPTWDSAIFCDECGEEIPQARREAIKGVRCCVECAEMMEGKK